MMRKLFCVAVVILVLGVITSAGSSRTETKPKPAVPRTNFALVNLAYVLKNYDKATAIRDDVKDEVETVQKREKDLRAELKDLTKQLSEEKDADKREEIEKAGRKLSHQLEELKADAQSAIMKKQDKSFTALYAEIREAVQRYAIANDIALVMHYNDAMPDSPEFNSPANVLRKVQAGATMPLYMAPGMDISKEVLEILNENYRREKAARSESPY
jgi:outer membrane protein